MDFHEKARKVLTDAYQDALESPASKPLKKSCLTHD